jgi:hypothetical protein
MQKSVKMCFYIYCVQCFNDMIRSTVGNLNTQLQKQKSIQKKKSEPRLRTQHLQPFHIYISFPLTIYLLYCIIYTVYLPSYLPLTRYLHLFASLIVKTNLVLLRRSVNTFPNRKKFVPKKKRILIAAVGDHTFTIF